MTDQMNEMFTEGFYPAFDTISNFPSESISVGYANSSNNFATKCITIGKSVIPTRNNPVFVAKGGFVIPETLHLTTIDKCDACDFNLNDETIESNVAGISWSGEQSIYNLCFDCIRDMAIEYRAKQKWQEKNGNLLTNLQQQIKELTKTVTILQSKIQYMEESKNVKQDYASCTNTYEHNYYHGNNY